MIFSVCDLASQVKKACGSEALVSSTSGVTNQVDLQLAQRTVRPSAPSRPGSIMYSLAQDGQTMSMANQPGGMRPAKAYSSVHLVKGP